MSFPRYPTYKPSGVEWLGEVPEHWASRRLGFFFAERREKVSDKDFQALSVTKDGIVPQLDTAAKTDDGDNRKCVRTGDFVIQTEIELRKTSFDASWVAARNDSGSLGSAVMYQRKTCVSSSSLITPQNPAAGCQEVEYQSRLGR